VAYSKFKIDLLQDIMRYLRFKQEMRSICPEDSINMIHSLFKKEKK